MIKCTACKKNKDENQFYKNKNNKNGFHNQCKPCHKLSRKKSFNKHKTKIYNKIKRRKQSKREFILNLYKVNKPCADCHKIYHPVCMDFDHMDPSSKWDDISRLLGSDLSLDRIEEEIKKCELVCSNCHRLRTFHITN